MTPACSIVATRGADGRRNRGMPRRQRARGARSSQTCYAALADRLLEAGSNKAKAASTALRPFEQTTLPRAVAVADRGAI
jgi:hypothetical protein